ncbi:hypothetical protein CHS0354_009287 [Potamilus streckersoni]|uniref:Uncharacterized protein n=1 Tax=Potamilus streckersoni TaxID=2493646 RepID=A0AAE0T7G1_9BIVA|nr:hypothetical protein CHS0354_009287 [Potamilus streckersoni]
MATYIVGLVKDTLPDDIDLPDVDKHMIQADIDYCKQGSSGSDRSSDPGVGNEVSCRFSMSHSIDSDGYSTIGGGPTMDKTQYNNSQYVAL